ncbi:MAG: DNA repair protein RecO [Ruminococcus sp.]|nr:DNA repair protein RecO [Ruminococcus sp.]MBP3380802.1 DNA repair protein RecO [Ruminococcus sp.]
MITLEGIVLREKPYGEQDKFIDVITKDRGLLEVAVKGARKITGRSSSSTQLFAYSRFCINNSKDRLTLNSAEPIHIFYDLRKSLTGLSLAAYFADVLRFSTAERTDSGNVMRLFLNTLHFLEKGLRNEKMLKSIFELRLMSEIGFMPDVVCCRGCGAFEPKELYFSVMGGGFVCPDCAGGEQLENDFKMELPVLSAVRHIVLADFSRLFNFRLSEHALDRLSVFAEIYILSHFERSFSTLDFYKNLL